MLVWTSFLAGFVTCEVAYACLYVVGSIDSWDKQILDKFFLNLDMFLLGACFTRGSLLILLYMLGVILFLLFITFVVM